MSAAALESFPAAEIRRLMAGLVVNAAFPTLFLWVERFIFHTDLPGYLRFARELGRLGFLPPDVMHREWTIWESTYKNARVGANFGYEANGYIVFIIPVLFLAYYLWSRAGTARARLGFGALGLFLLSGLLTSLSRTGVFTLAACIFLFASARHKLIVAAAVAALGAGLLALFPDSYFVQRYTMQSADSYSFAYKFIQIAQAFKSVVTNPVSLLFGEPALVDKASGGFNPHNQFMYDMMAKGILGLATGAGMFLAFFRRATAPEGAPESVDAPRLRAIKLGLTSVFITCLSTHVLQSSNTSAILWVLVFFLAHSAAETRKYVVRL